MKVVITAGGTGGHIFPALSVALAFRKKDPSVSLKWVGTSRSREIELCNKNGIDIKVIDVIGINRRKPVTIFFALVKFIISSIVIFFEFRKDRPDTVIAFGGYVCAPVLFAAKLNNIPYFLQEQNTVPGVVTKMFASSARKIFLGYPLDRKYSLKCNTVFSGNPVREKEDYSTFKYPDGIRKNYKTVLICGGSQGAASMNDHLVECVEYLSENDYQVIWQSGKLSFNSLENRFFGNNVIHIYASLDDMYPFYELADFVIGRSGASTLSEVAIFGKPIIMIPLPWSAENHQWMNAGFVEEEGWGIRLEQNEECSIKIVETVNKIITDKDEIYTKLLCNASKVSQKRATEIIYSDIYDEINNDGK